MAENDTPLKINDILALLDNANKSLESKVKLPSIAEEVVLLPLNANHTKNIIKSATSGLFSDNQFNLVFFQILNEVVKCPLASLNLYDKEIISLFLRSKNISDNLDVEVSGLVKDEEGEDKVDRTKKTVSISTILEKLKPVTFEDQVIECDEYNVVMNFPSIVEEYSFDEHLFKNKLASIDEENKKSLKGLIGPIFVYNIAQYVKELVIGDKTVSLSNKKVEERLAVVEKLSANSINKIIQKIDSHFGKMLQSITDVSYTKDGTKYSGSITIGAELFISN